MATIRPRMVITATIRPRMATDNPQDHMRVQAWMLATMLRQVFARKGGANRLQPPLPLLADFVEKLLLVQGLVTEDRP